MLREIGGWSMVAGRWVYLYRAIDRHGQVIDVLASAKRDLTATAGSSPGRSSTPDSRWR
jgi:hypothetical protein